MKQSRNRRHRRLALGSAVALLLVLPLTVTHFLAAAPLTVEVIVNAANPVSELPADEVSKMFLKKTNRWAGGEAVIPVDLPEQSAVRAAFSTEVHKRQTTAVKAYWQKMIFSGREVPPPEKSSLAELVAFVRANRGAIGYVPAGFEAGSGIKVLKVRP
jgi:ABC-type phosphate transport system substrate-binding protein